MLKRLGVISYDSRKYGFLFDTITKYSMGETILVYSTPVSLFFFFENYYLCDEICAAYHDEVCEFCDVVICDEYVESDNYMITPSNTNILVYRLNNGIYECEEESFAGDEIELVLEELSDETLEFLKTFSDEDECEESFPREEMVNLILDKINKEGIDSLTEKDKNILYGAN